MHKAALAIAEVCPTYVGMNRETVENSRRDAVCPTYVGMNRTLRAWWVASVSMPHVCGDEPLISFTATGDIVYAPRMWG